MSGAEAAFQKSELEAERSLKVRRSELENELDAIRTELKKDQGRLKNREDNLDTKQERVAERESNMDRRDGILQAREAELGERGSELEQRMEEVLARLAEVASLSIEDARAQLMAQVEERCNSKVARYQTIKKVTLLPVDFTVESGEITPTMKVKRNVVNEKYATEIAALYEA